MRSLIFISLFLLYEACVAQFLKKTVPISASYAGVSIDLTGDLNGDGFDDYIVGAWLETDVQTNAGKAFVISGFDQSVTHELSSPSPEANGWFGYSIASGYDLNNDGFNDLVVGAPGESGGALGSGRVHVFSGQTAVLLYTLTSPNNVAEGRFGNAVLLQEDLDQNGSMEIIVAAYQENGAAITRSGQVHMFNTNVHASTLISPNPEQDGGFGWRLSPAQNYSGTNTLLVSAIYEDIDINSANGGRIYAFDATSLGSPAFATIQAQTPGVFANFGYSVASSDLDGDGLSDIMATDGNQQLEVIYSSDPVFIISGFGPSVIPLKFSPDNIIDYASPERIINGFTKAEYAVTGIDREGSNYFLFENGFGDDIANIGDLNSDGIDDMVALSTDYVGQSTVIQLNSDATSSFFPKVTYSTSPDMTTALFNNATFSFTAQTTQAAGMEMSPDGTRLFAIGGTMVYQYDLGVAFDISSATFSGSAASGDALPEDIALSDDGSKMFIIGGGGDNIQEYNLGTSWDITTGTFVADFIVSGETAQPHSIHFNNDGTRLFVLGQTTTSTPNLFQYTLSSPYAISTAILAASTEVVGNPRGMKFNKDGTKVYIGSTNRIYEYELSTPFDLGAVTQTAFVDIGTEVFQPVDLIFDSKGLNMWVLDSDVDDASEFSLSGFAFTENIEDDGAVSGSLIVCIADDTFVNAGGFLSESTMYTVSNLPVGLSPAMDVSSDGRTATLTLSGNATNNLDSDDISDLQFTFTDAAFTSSLASEVINATGPASSNLGIDFMGTSSSNPFSFSNSTDFIQVEEGRMITYNSTLNSSSGTTEEVEIRIVTGDTIFFEKIDSADWTLTTNQDQVSSGVTFTRQNTQGLYNIQNEVSYLNTSPGLTLWSALPSAVELNYTQTWVQSHGSTPPNLVDSVFSFITQDGDNRQYDIIFRSWTEAGTGGGFSYDRIEIPNFISQKGFNSTFTTSTAVDVDIDATNLTPGTYSFKIISTDTQTGEQAVKSIDIEITVPSTGNLLGYYPFSGDPLDQSGNSNNGSEQGGIVLTSDRLGITDQSYFFDGVDDHISINTGTGISIDGDITFNAWIRPDDLRFAYIVFDESSDFGDFVINDDSTDIFAGYSYWDGSQNRDLFPLSNPLIVGVWTMVTLTRSGDFISVYYDGTLVGTGTAVDPPSASVPTFIGGTDDFFLGGIDEVRIYDYALTDQEIQDIYDQESPDVPPAEPTLPLTRILGPDAVELRWADNATNESQYTVEWFTDGGATLIGSASLPADAQFDIITGLTPGIDYQFEVFASNPAASSFPAIVNETTVDLGAPAVTVSPQIFTLDETLTITVDPAMLYPPGELDITNDIYIHTGLVAEGNEGQGGWSAAPGLNFTAADAGLMSENGDGTFSIVISDPRTFYGEDGSFQPTQIGMLFRNVEGTQVGLGPWNSASNNGDIFVDIFNPQTVEPPDDLFLIVSDQGDLTLFDNEAPDPSAYNISGPFTIEMWVNSAVANQSASETVLFSRGDNSDFIDAYGFLLTSGSWNFEVYNSTSMAYVSAASPEAAEDDTWIHLAGVWDGSEIRLYVNGIQKASTPFTGTLYVPPFDPFIQVGRNDLNISVNDLRIWNITRSLDEIRSYISTSLTGTESGLVGYWPMNNLDNDGVDDFTPDLVVGNDLIATGVDIPVQPDLVVSSITLTNSTVSHFESLEVNFTINNSGTADVDVLSELITAFYLSTNTSLDGIVYNLGSLGEGVTFVASGGEVNGSYSVILGDDVPLGTFFVFVEVDFDDVVEESDENNVYFSNDAQVTVGPENIPPTISFSPPSSAVAQDLEISITAEDNVEIESVDLYVRGASAPVSSERFASIEFVSGNQYRATIATGDFDQQGVAVRAVATDVAGNSAETATRVITREIPPSENITVNNIKVGSGVTDYQIIGWPFESKLSNQVFLDLDEKAKDWRLASYSGSSSEYTFGVIQLRPGRGYWLIVDSEARTTSFSGVQLVESDGVYTMSVTNGWNLIGNPFLAQLNWDNVLTYNIGQSIIEDGDVSRLVTYDGGYGFDATMRFFEGAFIFSGRTVTLEIPLQLLSGSGRIGAEGTGPRQSIYNDGGWEMVVELENDQGLRYGLGGFGEFEDAEDGRDKFDIPVIPAFSEFISINYLEDGLTNITSSITKVKENNKWVFEVKSHHEDPVAMSMRFIGQPMLQENERLVLMDVQSGDILDIYNGGVYHFSHRPGYTFHVLKGTSEYIHDNASISRVLVNNLYPNPANGEINIPLFLPDEIGSNVSISMRDLSGKEVLMKRFKALARGKHVLALILGDVQPSSGLYFVEISVESQHGGTESLHRKVYVEKDH